MGVQGSRTAAGYGPHHHDDYKQLIQDLLSDGSQYTILEIKSLVPDFAAISDQRLSAVIRQLVLSGEVIRVELGAKAYFYLDK